MGVGYRQLISAVVIAGILGAIGYCRTGTCEETEHAMAQAQLPIMPNMSYF